MGEMIWFLGENGGTFAHDITTMTDEMKRRLRDGVLRRINPDGTSWEGPLFGALPAEMTIDTLRGYRFWTAGRSGYLSSANSFVWAPGEWAEAECISCTVVPAQDACQGSYGHGCGLYAAGSPSRVDKHFPWGVIEAKGRIVVHDAGFRAQYARVIALVRPSEDKHLRAVEAAGRRYDVPVLPEESLLAEYPPDTGRLAVPPPEPEPEFY